MSKRTKLGSLDPNHPVFVIAFVAALLLVGWLGLRATNPKNQPIEPVSTIPVMKAMPVAGVTPLNPQFKTPKMGENSFILRQPADSEDSTELKSLKSKVFATYYYEDGKPYVKLEWNGMMFSIDEEFSQIGSWYIRLAGYNEQGAVLESDPLPY